MPFESFMIRRKEGVFPMYIAISNKQLKELLEEEKNFLHPEERDYLNNLPQGTRGHSFLLGRYTAKLAASAYTGVPATELLIKPGVFQQPVLQGSNVSNVQLSIAHSGEWSIAIVFPESHPVAADVEIIKSGNDLSRLIPLTSGENKMLHALPFGLDASMTLAWTIKEAMSKVIKTGLTASLEIFTISSIELRDNYLVCQFTNFAQYKAIAWIEHHAAWCIVLPRNSDPDISKLHILRQKALHAESQPH
ncbi:phosphopantetheinyl transferase [Chitinophaga niastensis]|uniref:Phosphopantetheinyl transferase n=1 Tax=Chitinophaga niastensis TaxID=536980 RepID=A0A2P8HPQ0_CHINA|nr:4'-phosphopantetheinyl transferase [Chitinophaga niastensis]PSL48181.1 phosphopantetheinyl transferase [Chitinophaga niastensis]